jgi:hypothetical protein
MMALANEIERLQRELDLDSSWPIVERFLVAAGIEPTSWHETTADQIERAIATVVEWRRDAARLDWLDSHSYSSYSDGDSCNCVIVPDRGRLSGGFTGPLREAIDEAAKETSSG